MSKKTSIQWSDSTVNGVMGCDGCELWPTPGQIRTAVRRHLSSAFPATPAQSITSAVDAINWDDTASAIYHHRAPLAAELLHHVNNDHVSTAAVNGLAKAIAAQFKCYAGILHLRHGTDATKPHKTVNSGYAPLFERVTKFPGRMAEAAKWSDLTGTVRIGSPWKDGLPRMIFVSDMSDALSAEIDFEYLRDEIITNVTSIEGQRHVWQWLTKRPPRMAEFSRWLISQGLTWPANLMAMTSVTSHGTVGRIQHLLQVDAPMRGLSVEPLWDAVQLPLTGIDWVIVGGESGPYAEPFDVSWARDVLHQCRTAGVACFVKQLGARPVDNGQPMKLADRHGGEWEELPADLRVREFPAGFYRGESGRP